MDTTELSEREILIGCGPYDRMSALADGKVNAPGYRLQVRTMDVTKIPDAAYGTGELDVAEISLGEYLSMLDKGDRRYTAIPAFPSMAFRHDCLYVADGSPAHSPSDLSGRRVGVTVAFGTTVVWVRHWLETQFGVDPRSITWVVGKLDSPTGPRSVPSNSALRFEACNPGDSLTSMLADGRLDAIVSYTQPLQNKMKLRRLPQTPMVHATEYYRRFGSIPLLHLFAYRSDLAEQNPRFPKILMDALTRSKEMALDELRQSACYTSSLVFLADNVAAATDLLGHDIWPYGLDRNRPALEIFRDVSVKHGHIRRRIELAEMFPDFS